MTLSFSVTTDTLAQFIDAAHALVDEAKIHATDDGLRITAVDPANVGMITETLGVDAFGDYSVDDGDGMTLGVNLGRLADILSMGDGDDVWYVREDGRKVIMTNAGLEYTMATISTDSIREEPDIPDLELPVTPRVQWRRVDRALTAADMVSDHVALGTDADSEGIYASAEGDTDDVFEQIAADDLEDGSDVPAGESVESLFSLDYLKDMKGPIPGDTVAELELGQEFPIKIHWGTDVMSVTYALAPRIDS